VDSHVVQLQVIRFVQKASGIEMLRGQAARFARRFIPKPIDFFTQIQKLDAFVAHMRCRDPGGVYNVVWDDQHRFVSLDVIPSWWIASGEYLRPLSTVDGTAVETLLGGTLLTNVTLSANNNLMPLALRVCASEQGESVKVLGDLMQENYPTQTDVVTDAGPGLLAGMRDAGFPRQLGCTFHISYKNAVKQVKILLI